MDISFPAWHLRSILNPTTNEIDITSEDDSINENKYLYKLFLNQVGCDVFILCGSEQEDRNVVTLRGHKCYLMTVSKKLFKILNARDAKAGDAVLDYHTYSERLVKAAFKLIYLKECSVPLVEFETFLKLLHYEWEILSLLNFAQLMEAINNTTSDPLQIQVISDEDMSTDHSESPARTTKRKITQERIQIKKLRAVSTPKRSMTGPGSGCKVAFQPIRTPPASSSNIIEIDELTLTATRQDVNDTGNNEEISNVHAIIDVPSAPKSTMKNSSFVSSTANNSHEGSPAPTYAPPGPSSKKNVSVNKQNKNK